MEVGTAGNKAVDVRRSPRLHVASPNGTHRVPSSNTLAIESAIATAHRALATAALYASALSDLGLHDDLQLIQLELERLQVDLLRGGKPRRLKRSPDNVS